MSANSRCAECKTAVGDGIEICDGCRQFKMEENAVINTYLKFNHDLISSPDTPPDNIEVPKSRTIAEISQDQGKHLPTENELELGPTWKHSNWKQLKELSKVHGGKETSFRGVFPGSHSKWKALDLVFLRFKAVQHEKSAQELFGVHLDTELMERARYFLSALYNKPQKTNSPSIAVLRIKKQGQQHIIKVNFAGKTQELFRQKNMPAEGTMKHKLTRFLVHQTGKHKDSWAEYGFFESQNNGYCAKWNRQGNIEGECELEFREYVQSQTGLEDLIKNEDMWFELTSEQFKYILHLKQLSVIHKEVKVDFFVAWLLDFLGFSSPPKLLTTFEMENDRQLTVQTDENKKRVQSSFKFTHQREIEAKGGLPIRLSEVPKQSSGGTEAEWVLEAKFQRQYFTIYHFQQKPLDKDIIAALQQSARILSKSKMPVANSSTVQIEPWGNHRIIWGSHSGAIQKGHYRNTPNVWVSTPDFVGETFGKYSSWNGKYITFIVENKAGSNSEGNSISSKFPQVVGELLTQMLSNLKLKPDESISTHQGVGIQIVGTKIRAFILIASKKYLVELLLGIRPTSHPALRVWPEYGIADFSGNLEQRIHAFSILACLLTLVKKCAGKDDHSIVKK